MKTIISTLLIGIILGSVSPAWTADAKPEQPSKRVVRRPKSSHHASLKLSADVSEALQQYGNVKVEHLRREETKKKSRRHSVRQENVQARVDELRAQGVDVDGMDVSEFQKPKKKAKRRRSTSATVSLVRGGPSETVVISAEDDKVEMDQILPDANAFTELAKFEIIPRTQEELPVEISSRVGEMKNAFWIALSNRRISRVMHKNDPGIVERLGKVLVALGSKVEIAHAIYALCKLSEPGLVTEEEKDFFAANLSNIFLTEGPMSNEVLSKVVSFLLPLKREQAVVALVRNNWLLAQDDHDELNVLGDVFNNLNASSNPPFDAETIAAAISEVSRRHFADICMANWVETIAKTKIGTWTTNFTNFVRLSILWRGEGRILDTYHFWRTVYTELENRGDLFGAYSIALALNNQLVTRHIKESDRADFSLTEDDALRTKYRAWERPFKERLEQEKLFFLPYLPYDQRSIILLTEIQLVAGTDEQPVLQMRTIEIVDELMKQYSQLRSLARAMSYEVPETLVGVFENLPVVTDDLVIAVSYYLQPFREAKKPKKERKLKSSDSARDSIALPSPILPPQPAPALQNWTLADIECIAQKYLEDDWREAMYILVTQFGIVSGEDFIALIDKKIHIRYLANCASENKVLREGLNLIFAHVIKLMSLTIKDKADIIKDDDLDDGSAIGRLRFESIEKIVPRENVLSPRRVGILRRDYDPSPRKAAEDKLPTPRDKSPEKQVVILRKERGNAKEPNRRSVSFTHKDKQKRDSILAPNTSEKDLKQMKRVPSLRLQNLKNPSDPQ